MNWSTVQIVVQYKETREVPLCNTSNERGEIVCYHLDLATENEYSTWIIRIFLAAL